MKITVYSKPNCQQCRATERWLNDKGLQFEYLDVTESPAAMASAEATGLRSMPIVVAEGHAPWGGFLPGNLAALLEI